MPRGGPGQGGPAISLRPLGGLAEGEGGSRAKRARPKKWRGRPLRGRRLSVRPARGWLGGKGGARGAAQKRVQMSTAPARGHPITV
eukprot:scaffold3791_cov390-Prasinococcus_capsulatus_cf.AAC.8